MAQVRTMDFQDRNNNGTDDRDEGQTTTRNGNTADTPDQQQSQSQGQQQSPGADTGYMNFKGIMDGIYGYEPNEYDDEGRAMKNAFGYDMLGKFFDSMLSRSMGQYQAGLSKDMMNHAFGLEQMGLSNSRKEEFGYGMRAMDKQYELQNLFANQEHGRALGTLAATGEQTRLTTSNEYNERRKNTVVEGEQNRLLEAAKGDQERKTTRTRGEQDRLLEVTRGQQTRKTERVKGQEERLNIGAKGDQERKTVDFTDQIAARREGRERSRAAAAARAF